MWSVVVALILPLPELLVDEVNVLADALLVKQVIELLVVHPVGSLNLAVQIRCVGADVDVADVSGFHNDVLRDVRRIQVPRT